MGPITDHAFEHLVPSDQMVARTRRRVLRAALALREQGTPPPGVTNPEVMWRARSGSFHTAAEVDWQTAYEDNLKKALRVSSTAPA
jgi:phthalate 4,5-dioxygenase oxygenase subunit